MLTKRLIEVGTGGNVGIETGGGFIKITRKPRFLLPDKVTVEITSKRGAAHFAKNEGPHKLRINEYTEA